MLSNGQPQHRPQPRQDIKPTVIPESPPPPTKRQTREAPVDVDGLSSPTTRQTRASARTISRVRSPTPKGWSESTPGWRGQWRNSLVFPAEGKSRATVDLDDIPRLDEGQFLNDNLIIFYLRYLQYHLEKEYPGLAERVYFHNTFFYDKLKPSRAGGAINYDSVKSWTSKVDLFQKDFIIVPINEYSHWYVAIIYNAPKLLPQPGNPDVAGAAISSAAQNPISLDYDRIITLDSLGGAHSPACQALTKYLVAEMMDKKDIAIEPPKSLGMTAKDVPQQHNYCDCGLFLLGYIRQLLQDPDSFVRNIL
ncbi:uncharacterized protein BCR38DRAFT_331423, partial [Pseudomassariella vexata]